MGSNQDHKLKTYAEKANERLINTILHFKHIIKYRMNDGCIFPRVYSGFTMTADTTMMRLALM